MNHDFPQSSLVSTGIRESLSQAPLFQSDRRHEQNVLGIFVAMRECDWQSFRFAEEMSGALRAITHVLE